MGMCGRYTLDLNAKRLAEQYGLESILDTLTPRFNIAPGQRIIAIGMKPDGVTRGLAKLQWGLIPSWVDDWKMSPRPINARLESILEKPMFRGAMAKRRCIVPASGFFEWKSSGKKKKSAVLIRPRDGGIMAFAGLWESWNRGPEKIASGCIITKDACSSIRPLHDRMPVMLPPELFADWLSPHTSPNDAVKILENAPPPELELIPVGSAVNAVANDGPDCIAPLMEEPPA